MTGVESALPGWCPDGPRTDVRHTSVSRDLSEEVSWETGDKLKEALIESERQLFGVR